LSSPSHLRPKGHRQPKTHGRRRHSPRLNSSLFAPQITCCEIVGEALKAHLSMWRDRGHDVHVIVACAGAGALLRLPGCVLLWRHKPPLDPGPHLRIILHPGTLRAASATHPSTCRVAQPPTTSKEKGQSKEESCSHVLCQAALGPYIAPLKEYGSATGCQHRMITSPGCRLQPAHPAPCSHLARLVADLLGKGAPRLLGTIPAGVNNTRAAISAGIIGPCTNVPHMACTAGEIEARLLQHQHS
jgi:hypothetical protein